MNKAEIEALLAKPVQRKPGENYVLMLCLRAKNLTDCCGEWFESDIKGTHDHCESFMQGGSLDEHFHVRLVEKPCQKQLPTCRRWCRCKKEVAV